MSEQANDALKAGLKELMYTGGKKVDKQLQDSLYNISVQLQKAIPQNWAFAVFVIKPNQVATESQVYYQSNLEVEDVKIMLQDFINNLENKLLN